MSFAKDSYARIYRLFILADLNTISENWIDFNSRSDEIPVNPLITKDVAVMMRELRESFAPLLSITILGD